MGNWRMEWVTSTLHTTSGHILSSIRARAETDGTRAETKFRLSPKRKSQFKSEGESVQSTAGRRGVHQR